MRCNALALCFVVLSQAAAAAPLSLSVRGYAVQQEVFSLFAAPGEQVRVDLPGHRASSLTVEAPGDVVTEVGEGYWTVTAPGQPGLYVLEMKAAGGVARTRLNLFVGTSIAPGEETLNGYRIGPPPPGNARYPAFYPSPPLYFEVTEANMDTPLSDHFTLRQFVCKQVSEFPKYVVIKESLLVLLEGLVTAVRAEGIEIETLGVISAYRTPWYNRRIGNVPNSRHVYGDAMDVFVDADGDGRMDDLDGDGELGRGDVDRFYALVESFKAAPGNGLLVGGVGRYYANRAHGGFVHVDSRGFRARW